MASVATGGETCLIKWGKPVPRIMKSLIFYHRIESTDRPPYTDVDVYCKGGYIPVHSVVLLACSEIWRDAFESMSPLQREHVIVHMTEYDIEDVTAVIECLYTGKCIFPAQRNQQVLEVFENFGIDSTPLTPKPATDAEIAGKMKMRRYLEDVIDDVHDGAGPENALLATNNPQPKVNQLHESSDDDAESSVSKYVEEGEEIVLSDLDSEEEAELTNKTVQEVRQDRRIRRGDLLEGEDDLDGHDQNDDLNPEAPEFLDPEAEVDAEMNENLLEGSDQCSESSKRGSKRDREDSSPSSGSYSKHKKSKTQEKSNGFSPADHESSSSKSSGKSDSSASELLRPTRRQFSINRKNEDESTLTDRKTRQSSRKENEDLDEKNKPDEQHRPERRSKIEGSSRIHKMFQDEVPRSHTTSSVGAKTDKDIDKDIEPAELCEIRHCRITIQKLPHQEYKKYWTKFRGQLDTTLSEVVNAATSEVPVDETTDVLSQLLNESTAERTTPITEKQTEVKEHGVETDNHDSGSTNIVELTQEDYDLRSEEWSCVVRKCPICDTDYGSHVGAKRCLKTHNMIRCWICLNVFGNMSLEDHFKVEHDGDSLKPGYANCPLCPDVMPCSSIQSHVIGKHLALVVDKKEIVEEELVQEDFMEEELVEEEIMEEELVEEEHVQEEPEKGEIEVPVEANSSTDDTQEDTEGFIRIKSASQLFEMDPDDGEEGEAGRTSPRTGLQDRNAKAAQVPVTPASGNESQAQSSAQRPSRSDHYVSSAAADTGRSFAVLNTALTSDVSSTTVTQPNSLLVDSTPSQVNITTADSSSSTHFSTHVTEKQAQRVAGGIRNYFSDNPLKASISQAQTIPDVTASNLPPVSLPNPTTNVGERWDVPQWTPTQSDACPTANATVVLRSASAYNVANPKTAMLPARPSFTVDRVTPPSYLPSTLNSGRNNQYILNSASTAHTPNTNSNPVFCGRTQFDGFPFSVYRENSELTPTSEAYTISSQNTAGQPISTGFIVSSAPTPGPNNMIALNSNLPRNELQYTSPDEDFWKRFTYDNITHTFTCNACDLLYRTKQSAESHLCCCEPD